MLTLEYVPWQMSIGDCNTLHKYRTIDSYIGFLDFWNAIKFNINHVEPPRNIKLMVFDEFIDSAETIYTYFYAKDITTTLDKNIVSDHNNIEIIGINNHIIQELDEAHILCIDYDREIVHLNLSDKVPDIIIELMNRGHDGQQFTQSYSYKLLDFYDTFIGNGEYKDGNFSEYIIAVYLYTKKPNSNQRIYVPVNLMVYSSRLNPNQQSQKEYIETFNKIKVDDIGTVRYKIIDDYELSYANSYSLSTKIALNKEVLPIAFHSTKTGVFYNLRHSYDIESNIEEHCINTIKGRIRRLEEFQSDADMV